MYKLHLFLFAAFAVLLSGCGGPIPTFTVATLPADYARPMVGKKNDIPLYIVNETTNLPEDGETNDQWPIPYSGLSSFVSRDIKGAFELYYSNVNVVAADAVPADGRGIIVSVRIDTLGYETQTATASNGVAAAASYPYMQWALGMKLVGGEEYFYTFAGKSMGSQNFTTKSNVIPAFQKLLGDAVGDFLKSYVEKDVHSLVMSLDSGEAPSDEAPSDEAPAEE